MLEQPCITQNQTHHIAVIRMRIPRDQIQHVMGPGLQELLAEVVAQGIGIPGPWFTHHFRMDPEVFDFEIGVPVSAPVQPVGRVLPSSLPAARVARAVYCGGYEGLGAAWGAFQEWITAQRLNTAEDLWECYVTGPETTQDPAGWRTELNKPLKD